MAQHDAEVDPYELVDDDANSQDDVHELKERLAELARRYGDTDEGYPELLERLKATP